MKVSLRRFIGLVLLLVSILPAYFVGVLVIDGSSKRMEEKQQVAIESATQAISNRIDKQLTFTTKLSSWYASNRSIIHTVDNIYFSSVVWEMMEKFNDLASDVSAIYLLDENWQPTYDKNGSLYHLENSRLLSLVKRNKAAYQDGKSVHTAFYETGLAHNVDQGIAIVTPLLPYRLLDGSKYTPKGYVLVLISFDSLEELAEPFILSQESVEFVYGEAPLQLMSEDIIHGVEVDDPLLSEPLHLWFKQRVSSAEREKEAAESKDGLILIVSFVTLVCVLIVFCFNAVFSDQIQKLENLMDHYIKDGGKQHKRIHFIFSEFNQLGRLLAKMWFSINQHVEELEVKNSALSEANHQVELLNQTLENRVKLKTRKLEIALQREEEQQQQLLQVIEFFSKPYDGCYLDVPKVVTSQLKQLAAEQEPEFIFGEVDEQDSNHGSMPIVNSQGKLHGTVLFHSDAPMSAEQNLTLTIYTRQLAGWLDLKKHMRTDQQVCSLNRHAFDDDFLTLKQRTMEEGSQPLSLHIIDINGLKPTNDCLGHDAGDALIRAVSQLVKKHTPNHAHLYRIGGDEFALLTDGFNDLQGAHLAEELRDLQCQESILFNGHNIPLSFSIGYANTELHSVEQLFSAADADMYREKKQHYTLQS